MKHFALFFVAVAVAAAAGAAEIPDGKSVFKAKCLKCHGDSGTGTFMLGRRLGKEKALIESRTDLTPELVRHVVRNGIVSMPAITRVEVTDDELRLITQYLTKPRP